MAAQIIVTDQELQDFCTDQQNRYLAFVSQYNPTQTPKHYYEKGSRFARIVFDDDNQKRVVCFIDLTTGNIHKANSWKQACTTGNTKGVRGSIFDQDRGASCMTWCGTKYLRN
jgi:hypothetical protein